MINHKRNINTENFRAGIQRFASMFVDDGAHEVFNGLNAFFRLLLDKNHYISRKRGKLSDF